MPNRFALGRKAIAVCDMCGFQFKLNRLKMLTVKLKNVNMLVCRTCWTPDQPQLQVGMYPVDDPQALRNPRPDTSLHTEDDTYSSRDIQWGWNPVGMTNPLALPSLPNTLLTACSVGNVTVEIS